MAEEEKDTLNSTIIKLVRTDIEDDPLYFQTVTSFSSTNRSTLTNYPTSEGTPKTDNIYPEPITFTCSINIGGNEDIIDEWGVGKDRPSTARNMLTYFKDRAIPFQIETPQGTYFDMYLTTINPNNTPQDAYNFSAGLTFTQLFIAKYETVTVGPFENAQDKANESNSQSNGANNGIEILLDKLNKNSLTPVTAADKLKEKFNLTTNPVVNTIKKAMNWLFTPIWERV